MVGKCRGLPLAIIVLGGLLLHKENLQEWLKVKEQLWRQLRNGSIEISHLLSLSYNDLPRHLKPCFLYVGMFPEDHEFKARKLMQLWMAEDFVRGDTMEDVAEEYLKELIGRSLIQVTKLTYGDIVDMCKVHDLLRDLAVEKAQEIKFFDIYDPRKYSAVLSSNSRRLAVHSHIHNFFEINHTNSKLQSLVFFNPDRGHLKDTHIEFITKNLKSLRVLDIQKFQNLGSGRLPDTVGELIYLKLLWLTDISEVPHAIGNLKWLMFLNFGSCESATIPGEISRLKGLRELCGYDLGGNLRLESLTNLQTLGVVKSNTWCKIDTTNLVNLRRLQIWLEEPQDVIQSLQSVTNLKSLEDLHLTEFIGDHPIEIPLSPLSSCWSLLKLRIDGPIKNRKLPPINELPPYLEMLCLFDSQLIEDPFPVLKGLLNLKYLYLCQDSYIGKKIVCTAEGFHWLKILHLYYLRELEEWQAEKGAMPMLKTLNIYRCSNLKMFPEELECVRVTANPLKLEDM